MAIIVVIVKQHFPHCPGIVTMKKVMAHDVVGLLRGACFCLPHLKPYLVPQLV